MKHELKILPKYFEAVNCGKKNFEIRINDRNYQEDDELILKEWERGKYTGRECRRWVGYIYHGDGTYGIAENTVIMALKRSAPTACLDNDTADRKTENSSEKPNNCEHITEDGVTCAKYPACDDCLDNPLNKVKGSERLVKGLEKTDCQTCKWWSSYGYCVHRECKGYEPQTERSSE